MSVNKNEPATLVIAGLKKSGFYVDEPTLADGDVKISIDGGAFANLDSVPSTVSGTPLVDISLLAAETNGDSIVIQFEDQTSPSAWDRCFVRFNTVDYVADIDSILADTVDIQGTVNSIEADTTDILIDTSATLVSQINGIEAKVDTIDTNVDAVLLDTGSTLAGQIASILADTDELQTNQGDWVTATGFATAADLAIVDANVDAILVDTATTLPGLIGDVAGDVWDFAAAGPFAVDSMGLYINQIGIETADILVDTATTLPATLSTISGLVSANGTTIGQIPAAVWNSLTTTTYPANSFGEYVKDIGLETDAILIDTADLQANQGNWLTATGFATSNDVDTLLTDYELDLVKPVVDAILVDTGTTIPVQLTTEFNAQSSSFGVVNGTLASMSSDISGIAAGVTVTSITAGALALFVTTDTTETSATAGSVAALAQAGTGGSLNANIVSVNGNPVTLDDLEFYIDHFKPVRNKQLELVRGDAYKDSIGTAISFEDATYIDLSALGNTDCKLTVKNETDGTVVLDHVSSISVNSVTKTIKFDLTGAQTDLDPDKKYKYDMEAHFGADVVTLSRGKCIVTDNVE